VGWYTITLAHPSQAAAVSRAIDGAFANSTWETRTQTEKAFARSFVKQMGDVQSLVLVVGGVVFFTLVLVTGNTMALAVGERTSEHGVLKALGFGDGVVVFLVFAESLLTAAVGGAAGLALVAAFTALGDPTGGLLPFFYLPPAAVPAGMAAALAVGAVAGLVPALGAMRLSVVDALRRV
jgi:putative ABC transport system permease protein